MWSDGRFLEVVPHRDPLKAAVAQPTPGAGPSQGWTWLSPPPPPRRPSSHGAAVILFFQFYQHPGETGGGPGVKGNHPYAWLRLEVGHAQPCMAWGGPLRPAVCMATAGSAQLCLAWLEWQCMNLGG